MCVGKHSQNILKLGLLKCNTTEMLGIDKNKKDGGHVFEPNWEAECKAKIELENAADQSNRTEQGYSSEAHMPQVQGHEFNYQYLPIKEEQDICKVTVSVH